MRPCTFRPPFFVTGSTRLFSGVCLVMSPNAETVRNRRPGLVGLYFLMAIGELPLNDSCAFEDLDLVALAQLNDRLLPAGPPPAMQTSALGLRPHLQNVDRDDLHVEEFL